MFSRIIISLLTVFLMFSYSSAFADYMPLSEFSLKNYDQHLDTWLKPNDPNYNKPLISKDYQLARTKEFYQHEFGESSPWSQSYIDKILSQQSDLYNVEKTLPQDYSNHNKSADQIGYGENYRPHTQQWIAAIADNMNLRQLLKLHYDPANRAIITNNTAARLLPTQSVHFYKYTYAGQGFPFDNLQMSAVWIGTPVYILGQSNDHEWDLVVTPAFIDWVPASAIAKVDQNFVDQWSLAAQNKMATVIHTGTAITDAKNNAYLYKTYVGTIFPVAAQDDNKNITVLVPYKEEAGDASIHQAILTQNQIAAMPLAATPHNFSRVMSSLINRPYGWGGLYFDNDCSQELRSIYAAFGIWLLRNSAQQVQAGKLVDKTSDTTDQRINYLMQHGHPLMTIVYIGGHIIMYLGNYPNPNAANQTMAMTYQNLWGLSPASGDRRAVIGQAALLPLLKQFPEDNSLASEASKKYFQVAFLDQWPNKTAAMTANRIDLRSMIYPEIQSE